MTRIRKYYTLRQVLGIADYVDWEAIISTNKQFHDYISQIPTSAEAKELFESYIAPLYLEEYVTYTDVELTAAEETKLFNEFKKYIYSWFQETYPRYSKLVSLYNKTATQLEAKIESETFSRYNDTPQSSGTGFDSDAYASNTNKVVSKSDGTTPIQRLEEIRRLLVNVYKEWSNDFGRKFVIYD